MSARAVAGAGGMGGLGGGTSGPLSRPAPARGPGGQVTARARGARATRATATGGGGNRGGASSAGILRFYSDEAPGLRVGPQVVLVSSLAFIGVVVLLHIWAKFTSR
uniref:Protein transport protein Sec61 subunit beta n=1 Tax=Nannochloropsis gaditana (strain CCMP526) TaxID=1093141 RepID=I2CQ18_NANGC